MAAQDPYARPRSRSMLSFGSHRSTGSVGKIDLHETPKDKMSRTMHTKADPTKAMTEAQPGAQALETATLESIRNLQHRDNNGNIITDPDRSNPTRPRLERPLDTIRSFEAAIDGSYNKRFSAKPEPMDPASAQSRRSSYFMGYNNVSAPQRFPGDSGGYYGNRMSYHRPERHERSERPESYVENGGNQQGHYNQYYQQNRRQFGPRNHSDPMLYGNKAHQVYPSHNNQQSYDTVTSGTRSHDTDQWGNSTDPSSENSSIDRIQQVPKPDLAEQYGFSGFGGAPQFQGPILEEFDNGSPAYGQPGYGQGSPTGGRPYQGNGVAPPPPVHGASPREIPPPVPIKLGPSAGGTAYGNGPVYSNGSARPSQLERADTGEKRKGWLKRRFSRKS